MFPNTGLFETIPGSDALLISAKSLPKGLPLEPTLSLDQLRTLSEGAAMNTDDNPWIEFEAPKSVNRQTGSINRLMIEQME